jgi:anti-sigma factor RsiW
MMEHIPEETLALYAGGDLPADEAIRVDVHLRACSECEVLVREYREAQELLAASVQDPELEELRELRDGIAARLSSGRRRAESWIWWAGAGAAAAIALLFASTFHQPVAAPVKAPETLWLKPALPAPHLEMAVVRKKRIRRESGIRTVALLTRPDEPSFIKMTTSDPNVVILWQPTERIQ